MTLETWHDAVKQDFPSWGRAQLYPTTKRDLFHSSPPEAAEAGTIGEVLLAAIHPLRVQGPMAWDLKDFSPRSCWHFIDGGPNSELPSSLCTQKTAWQSRDTLISSLDGADHQVFTSGSMLNQSSWGHGHGCATSWLTSAGAWARAVPADSASPVYHSTQKDLSATNYTVSASHLISHDRFKGSMAFSSQKCKLCILLGDFHL